VANAKIFDPFRLFLTKPNGLVLTYSVITDQSRSFHHHNQHDDHEFGVGKTKGPLKVCRFKILYGDNYSKIYKFYAPNFRVSNACCGVEPLYCNMWNVGTDVKTCTKPCVRVSNVRYVCLN